METSWFLSFQHEMQTTMCKYFKEYGDVKTAKNILQQEKVKNFVVKPVEKHNGKKKISNDGTGEQIKIQKKGTLNEFRRIINKTTKTSE